MRDMKTAAEKSTTKNKEIRELAKKEYKYGFVTDIDSETLPPGLDEDVIRFISAKKKEPEFMLEWRLKAYRHWLTMQEPTWAFVKYPPIDYQSIIYYSAPKTGADAPKSLDETVLGEGFRSNRPPSSAGRRRLGRVGAWPGPTP